MLMQNVAHVVQIPELNPLVVPDEKEKSSELTKMFHCCFCVFPQVFGVLWEMHCDLVLSGIAHI